MKHLFKIIIVFLLFFFNTKGIAQSPGGVSSSISAWYKADDVNSNGLLWNAISANGNNAPAGASTPIQLASSEAFNFNKSYNFIGNASAYFLPPNGPDFQLNDYSFFIVSSKDAKEIIWSQMTCGVRAQQFLILPYLNLGVYTFGVRGPNASTLGAQPPFFNLTIPSRNSSVYLANASRNGSGYTTKITTHTISNSSYTGGNGTVTEQPLIGKRFKCGNERPLTGSVSEIIVYKSDITGLDKQKVESYLALKYGLTLDHDYFASDGVTKTWDRTVNIAYNYDISGIGKDATSSLDQRQSRSSNDDSFVTFGLGSIAIDNANHQNAFAADKNFLIWANNNGLLISNESTSPLPFTEKLTRNWLVQETGNVSSVFLRIANSKLAGKFGSTNDLSLVVADDENFTSNAQIIALTYNSGNDSWETAVNFNGVKYFSFFSNIPNYMRHGKHFKDNIEKPMKF